MRKLQHRKTHPANHQTHHPDNFRITVELLENPGGKNPEFNLETNKPGGDKADSGKNTGKDAEMIQAYHACHTNPERILSYRKTAQRTLLRLQDNQIPSTMPEPLRQIAWWENLEPFKNPDKPWELEALHTCYRTPAGCSLCEAFQLVGIPYVLIHGKATERDKRILKNQAELVAVIYTEKPAEPRTRFNWDLKIQIESGELQPRKSRAYPKLNMAERALVPKDTKEEFQKIVRETLEWGKSTNKGAEIGKKAQALLAELYPHSHMTDYLDKFKWWTEIISPENARTSLQNLTVYTVCLQEFLDIPFKTPGEHNHLPLQFYNALSGTSVTSRDPQNKRLVLEAETQAMNRFLQRKTLREIIEPMIQNNKGVDYLVRMIIARVVPVEAMFPTPEEESWTGVLEIAKWLKQKPNPWSVAERARILEGLNPILTYLIRYESRIQNPQTLELKKKLLENLAENI